MLVAACAESVNGYIAPLNLNFGRVHLPHSIVENHACGIYVDIGAKRLLFVVGTRKEGRYVYIARELGVAIYVPAHIGVDAVHDGIHVDVEVHLSFLQRHLGVSCKSHILAIVAYR